MVFIKELSSLERTHECGNVQIPLVRLAQDDGSLVLIATCRYQAHVGHATVDRLLGSHFSAGAAHSAGHFHVGVVQPSRAAYLQAVLELVTLQRSMVEFTLLPYWLSVSGLYTHIIVDLLLCTHALAANAQIAQGDGSREEGRQRAVAGVAKV